MKEVDFHSETTDGPKRRLPSVGSPLKTLLRIKKIKSFIKNVKIYQVIRQRLTFDKNTNVHVEKSAKKKNNETQQPSEMSRGLTEFLDKCDFANEINESLLHHAIHKNERRPNFRGQRTPSVGR